MKLRFKHYPETDIELERWETPMYPHPTAKKPDFIKLAVLKIDDDCYEAWRIGTLWRFFQSCLGWAKTLKEAKGICKRYLEAEGVR